MSISIATADRGFAPPNSLTGWRSCANELRAKQSDNIAERDRLALLREESVLAAARGDVSAQERIVQMAAAETGLQVAAASLAQGLVVVAQQIDAAESHALAQERAAALTRFDDARTRRLNLVKEIEQRLRDVAPMLVRLGALTVEIEQGHLALGGVRPILPPLAQETVGGRLAEFMVGSGFADWLPLSRPEIRPALASWVEAERSVQEIYRLSA